MSGSSIGVIIPVSATTEANDSEKIYCNATIDDNFAPDSLLVVLNNETSLKIKTYSKSDFSEIKAKNVSHITTFSESRAQKAIKSVEAAVASRSTFVTVDAIDLSKYKQVLCIELDDTGKDKVLDAIKELEKRDEIFMSVRITISSLVQILQHKHTRRILKISGRTVQSNSERLWLKSILLRRFW